METPYYLRELFDPSRSFRVGLVIFDMNNMMIPGATALPCLSCGAIVEEVAEQMDLHYEFHRHIEKINRVVGVG